MTTPWSAILDKLPLSRTERAVVKRFEGDPEGRTFLPVADILRSHKMIDEAIEILTQGVARHPAFTIARVVLARELLAKGLVTESWRTLEHSPTALRDNLLAQKLRFKLAILLDSLDHAQATLQQLQMSNSVDSESRALADLIALGGITRARERLIADIKRRGGTVVLPEGNFLPTPEALPEAPPPSVGDPFDSSHASEINEREIAGFHVMPLTDVFEPGDMASTETTAGGVELDSSTLADIYMKQGHYPKALAMYRRLLRLTPHDDKLKRRVTELTRLAQDQRAHDMSIDPVVVDHMEQIERIDRQIRFLNDMLERLP
jgi:tetratricopeptide (TPR) repeat protein